MPGCCVPLAAAVAAIPSTGRSWLPARRLASRIRAAAVKPAHRWPRRSGRRSAGECAGGPSPRAWPCRLLSSCRPCVLSATGRWPPVPHPVGGTDARRHCACPPSRCGATTIRRANADRGLAAVISAVQLSRTDRSGGQPCTGQHRLPVHPQHIGSTLLPGSGVVCRAYPMPFLPDVSQSCPNLASKVAAPVQHRDHPGSTCGCLAQRPSTSLTRIIQRQLSWHYRWH